MTAKLRTLHPSSPPTPPPTVYAFPSQSAGHDGVQPSESSAEVTTLRPTTTSQQRLDDLVIEGPEAVEISDLLRLSIRSPRQLRDQPQTHWEVLNDAALTPSRCDGLSAEYLIPDTDHDQLIVAANLLFPNGHSHQLTKRVAVTGTNLSALVRSFQQVVAQGQFSPRLTKRLADRLLRARQALAQSDDDRLELHLHSFVRDCAQILRRKKSMPVSMLYHRARWLERQAKKHRQPEGISHRRS